MTDTSNYIGDELTLFSHAKNWKNYWGGHVRRFLGTRVLEVGAGLGGTTQYLNAPQQAKNYEKWLCLEPDATLAQHIETMVKTGQLPKNVTVLTQTLADLNPETGQFDAILYIDVIEHIEDDRAELLRTLPYLKTGGHLIILVPAHQFLFSPFDEAIGHFRRYSRPLLKERLPQGYQIISAKYLDSLGLAASLANKLFLRQRYPTLKQVLFWDNFIVPISTFLDKITFHRFGKSVLLIAKKM